MFCGPTQIYLWTRRCELVGGLFKQKLKIVRWRNRHFRVVKTLRIGIPCAAVPYWAFEVNSRRQPGPCPMRGANPRPHNIYAAVAQMVEQHDVRLWTVAGSSPASGPSSAHPPAATHLVRLGVMAIVDGTHVCALVYMPFSLHMRWASGYREPWFL